MFCQFPERFVAHVMIKRVKPLMGKATGPGVFGQRQLSGGRNVVGRNTQLPADAVLQSQGTAQ